jgi:hypothetical protein
MRSGIGGVTAAEHEGQKNEGEDILEEHRHGRTRVARRQARAGQREGEDHKGDQPEGCGHAHRREGHAPRQQQQQHAEAKQKVADREEDLMGTPVRKQRQEHRREHDQTFKAPEAGQQVAIATKSAAASARAGPRPLAPVGFARAPALPVRSPTFEMQTMAREGGGNIDQRS